MRWQGSLVIDQIENEEMRRALSNDTRDAPKVMSPIDSHRNYKKYREHLKSIE